VIPPKTLIGISAFLLVLSAVLGVLNTQRTRGSSAQVTRAETARHVAEELWPAREKELKRREAADLINAQKEKINLQTKLREKETENAQLLKRIEEAEGKPGVEANPSSAATAELQAQLDDAKKQLDAAEREKALLSDKVRAAHERSTQLEAEKKRRLPAGGNPGIHGTVLAVNQAYNFVVLNLGGRQGVEPNTEMLVLRGGSFIGRIRISSVEPATAIGDIITSSLARGVQVQPGDTVIYAGTNS
jgi:hypothetical protein